MAPARQWLHNGRLARRREAAVGAAFALLAVLGVLKVADVALQQAWIAGKDAPAPARPIVAPAIEAAPSRRSAIMAPVAAAGLAAAAAGPGPAGAAEVAQPSDSLRSINGLTPLLKPIYAQEAKWQAGNYDRASVQARIDSETNSAPVVVYSYGLSPFCTQAVDLLKSVGAKTKVVELGAEWLPGMLPADGAAVRAELGELTGRTSMPSIWIGGSCIGGLFDGSPGLVPLLESGKLMKRLEEAGAI